jgi:hypothetical protein
LKRSQQQHLPPPQRIFTPPTPRRAGRTAGFPARLSNPQQRRECSRVGIECDPAEACGSLRTGLPSQPAATNAVFARTSKPGARLTLNNHAPFSRSSHCPILPSFSHFRPRI